VTRNKEFATQISEDYTKADLNSRERLIADLPVKITRSPDACSSADIEKLRNEDFSDKDILSLFEIIAYQNMSTGDVFHKGCFACLHLIYGEVRDIFS
jgi:hypothetical protein